VIDYVKLEAMVKRKSDWAALIEVDGVSGWVPFTLFGKMTDAAVEATDTGDYVTVYVPDWKADELGWS